MFINMPTTNGAPAATDSSQDAIRALKGLACISAAFAGVMMCADMRSDALQVDKDGVCSGAFDIAKNTPRSGITQGMMLDRVTALRGDLMLDTLSCDVTVRNMDGTKEIKTFETPGTALTRYNVLDRRARKFAP